MRVLFSFTRMKSHDHKGKVVIVWTSVARVRTCIVSRLGNTIGFARRQIHACVCCVSLIRLVGRFVQI
jgi:hypothetical protein